MESRDGGTTVALSEGQRVSPRVGVVVVNYCSEADILRCLDSLATLVLPRVEGPLTEERPATAVEILIVDNHSPDGSGARVRSQVGVLQERLGASFALTVLLNSENSGFAAANNVGMSLLRKRGVTHIWLLNPDTTVDSRALIELLNYCEGFGQLVVCGSKVLYGDVVPAKIWSAGGVLERDAQRVGMRGLGEPDTGQFEVAERCDYIPGCSMFLPLPVLDRVGDMPERFFMYFEETDWCEAMTRSGIELRYVPASVVWHHFADDKLGRPFTVYYYNRNERLFWFHWSGAYKRLRLVGRTLFRDVPRVLRAIAAAPDDEHRAVFRAQLRAYLDFLLARSGR